MLYHETSILLKFGCALCLRPQLSLHPRRPFSLLFRRKRPNPRSRHRGPTKAKAERMRIRPPPWAPARPRAPRPGPGCAPERAVPRYAGAPCRPPAAWQGAGGSPGGRGGDVQEARRAAVKAAWMRFKECLFIYSLIVLFLGACLQFP